MLTDLYREWSPVQDSSGISIYTGSSKQSSLEIFGSSEHNICESLPHFHIAFLMKCIQTLNFFHNAINNQQKTEPF